MAGSKQSTSLPGSAIGSAAAPVITFAQNGSAVVAGTDNASTYTLTGGGGAETFVFSTPDLNSTVARVTAIITDFVTGTDKIQVTNGGAGAGAGAGSATTFVKAAAVVADLATLLTAADTALLAR